MSEQVQVPWSNSSNAPQIPYVLYRDEKTILAGFLMSAPLYGIVIALFFQCMVALLDPVNRAREGVKWGLVAHTTAMFSFATMYFGMGLNIQSLCFVDNREFTEGGVYSSGPTGYKIVLYREAISLVPNTLFLVNGWLADGLLLYRCFIIYGMNYWVIAFPCVMFLASVAMGASLVYQTSQPVETWVSIFLGSPYYAISLSLNVILTLMIIVRLALHSRDIRNALGRIVKPDRLYTMLITILVESSALYAVSCILYIAPWYAGNFLSNIFVIPLTVTQVIAPFLITLRVANRTALTSQDVTSGNIIGSLHFTNQEKSANGDEDLTDGNFEGSTEANEESPAEGSVGDESITEQVRR